MKKLLAVLLSLCLLLAAVPMSVFAAAPVDTDIVLSVEGAPETVYPGQTFSVNIKLSENTGIYTWRADLGYDSDVFTLVSCASSDFTEEDSVPRFSYKETTDNIRILWDAAGNANFTENGTIATVTFKVKDNAASGNYNFDLTFLDASRVINAKPFAEAINVTATDCSTKIEQIAVSEVEITDIDAKTDYYIGDELVINSVSLKVSYNNGDEKTVTEGYTTSYDFSAAGTKTVTINYEGGTDTFEVTVTSPYITLSDDAETVIAGEEYTLTADVLPSGVTVNWESNKEAVATVDGGVVTAVAEGEATITASFVYNGITYKADFVITVIPVVITGIEIDGFDGKIEYYVGDELVINTIVIKVTYNNGDTDEISTGYTTEYDFSTAGTKTVTVKYENFSDTFEVTVKTPSITLSDSEKVVILDKTYQITVDTIPEGVTVNWVSDNEDVATVVNGLVTAVSEGEATITASFTYQGTTYSAECDITVKKLLGDINDDGLVNTTDLAQLKLYLVGATTFTDKQLAVADVSQSGAVDTTDLALMKLYLAGVFSDFEANNQ